MIKKIHEQLLNGEVTAVALAEQSFATIAEKEPTLKAFLHLSQEEALAQAAAVDAQIAAGETVDLLAGIPCALKDNLCVKGGRTTAASMILDNYIAPYDATVVERVRAQGAVFLGKTNLDEFASGSSTENSAYQTTTHPLDANRVAGGSSGGSAAAVAAGEAVWSLGTDTGGSIRQPASFCGVVGLKPTYGRVSRYGAIALASSLDQIGPFATTVEDVAIVLSRIAGQDSRDATSAHSEGKLYEDYLRGDISGAKIGIPQEYLAQSGDARITEAFHAAVARFKELGAEIIDVSLPHTEYAIATYYIIMPAELSSNLARFDGIRYGAVHNDATGTDGRAAESITEHYMDTRQYGFGPEIKKRSILGTYALSAGHYDAYYKKAQQVQRLIRKDFEAAFEKVDYLFTPTTPEIAFPVGAKSDDPLSMYLSDIYTVTANLAGVPAISFPIGTVDEGGVALPVGGQLLGKWFDEEGILNAAHTYETT